jgi:hypothetical protein
MLVNLSNFVRLCCELQDLILVFRFFDERPQEKLKVEVELTSRVTRTTVSPKEQASNFKNANTRTRIH